MEYNVKLNMIWATALGVVFIALLVLVGFGMVSGANARQQKYEQCINNNMQWVSENCIR